MSRLWGVFNENGIIAKYTNKEEAEKFADKLNLRWQTCSFYVKEI